MLSKLENKIVLGIDEAGRGPIAGPLVIAGCILDYNKIDEDDPRYKKITDSKKLTATSRKELFHYIPEIAVGYFVSVQPAEKIDNRGIATCLREGIIEILTRLKDKYEVAAFDGKHKPVAADNLYMFVKGDSLVKEISAASIMAKHIRDHMMEYYDRKYPIYEFGSHKGYGTKKHVDKIREHGYSPIHRRSFRIKDLETLF